MKKEYLIYKLSEDLKEATRIENELFKKFDVKRGLRNEDGTGLIKFGCFEQRIGKDFDYTATGHYATTLQLSLIHICKSYPVYT